MKRFTLVTICISAVILMGIHDKGYTQFSSGNLVIYRVGDGVSALANTGNAVFLDEYTTAGTLVQSVAMPTTVSGSNQPFVAAGNASSEGLMTRSVDGQYLILAGYASTIPYASSLPATSSATVPRVIGVVSASASINTTTALTDAATGSNPRGACSTDGNALWISGGAGGARYTTSGVTTSVQLSTTPVNLRALSIFAGQLYTSSASGAFRLATIGTGTPTTSGQTTTNLPGFPTSTGSPYGFFFADLDAGVSGVDVVYVADDGGTIQKYSLVSGLWTANGTIATSNVRGITGSVAGTTVTIYATTASTSSPYTSNLITLTDASGYNATITGSVTTLATISSASKAFRGIAFAPSSGTPAPTIQASNIIFSGISSTGMTVSWTNGNGAGRVVKMNTTNSFTNPTDGTTPTANTVYGGSGEQVIYNNSGSSVSVTGLTGAITYWFRVYEYNGSGSTTKYLTSSATNNPNSQTTPAAPTVATAAASGLSSSGATLNGTVNANTLSTTVTFDYGLTTNYGTTVTAIQSPVTGFSVTPVSYPLTGLAPNTLYHFRVVGVNALGTSNGMT